jgi:type I restriction enzyme S subunit
MVRQATGASYPAVNDKIVRASRIPLVPSSEQRRIAGILDKADAIRRKRQQAIDLTDQLLRSAFLDMFGDPVTNPKRWPDATFAAVGTLDRGKSRHRPRNDPDLLGGKYPLIQTGDVSNSDGVIRRYTQTYSELGLAQSRLWPAGTLCITIAANIAETGILAFDACFPDSVVGFHPGPEVTTEYVQGWLGFLQPLIEARAPQVAQKNINLRILRALEIPVPPRDLQERHARCVAATRAATDCMRAAVRQAHELFNSLVQRAFRGEL